MFNLSFKERESTFKYVCDYFIPVYLRWVLLEVNGWTLLSICVGVDSSG